MALLLLTIPEYPSGLCFVMFGPIFYWPQHASDNLDALWRPFWYTASAVLQVFLLAK